MSVRAVADSFGDTDTDTNPAAAEPVSTAHEHADGATAHPDADTGDLADRVASDHNGDFHTDTNFFTDPAEPDPDLDGERHADAAFANARESDGHRHAHTDARDPDAGADALEESCPSDRSRYGT